MKYILLLKCPPGQPVGRAQLLKGDRISEAWPPLSAGEGTEG